MFCAFLECPILVDTLYTITYIEFSFVTVYEHPLNVADLTDFRFNHVGSRYISSVVLYVTFFGIVEAHIKYI